MTSDSMLDTDSTGAPTAAGSRASDPDYVGPERRTEVAYSGPDRRKFTWKTVIYGMFKKRRTRARRTADAPNAYVDIHEMNLLVVATIILGLSVLDGVLTVHLANIGATDLNGMMAALVKRDAVQYAIVKWLLTAFAVVALIISERAHLFGRIRGAYVLYGIAAVYSFFVAYSLSMAVIYS